MESFMSSSNELNIDCLGIYIWTNDGPRRLTAGLYLREMRLPQFGGGRYKVLEVLYRRRHNLLMIRRFLGTCLTFNLDGSIDFNVDGEAPPIARNYFAQLQAARNAKVADLSLLREAKETPAAVSWEPTYAEEELIIADLQAIGTPGSRPIPLASRYKRSKAHSSAKS
jgi:hypothetical protein